MARTGPRLPPHPLGAAARMRFAAAARTRFATSVAGDADEFYRA